MEIKTSSDISMDMSLNLVRYKIVFVGDVSVGKTSIIKRLMENKFSDTYDPSIGVDFFSKTLRFRNKSVKLQVWDSAGQEKYRSLIPNYIRGSSIIFIIFDVTNKHTFDSVSSWLKFIKNIESPIIILCGNKIDLNEERQVFVKEAASFAEQENIIYFEISAKLGDNLKKMIYSSVAELPFFEQFKSLADDLSILNELEIENTEKSSGTSNNNLSILDSSRGTIQINRSEIIQRKKGDCKCQK